MPLQLPSRIPNYTKTRTYQAYLHGGLSAFRHVVATCPADEKTEMQAILYFAIEHYGIRVPAVATALNVSSGTVIHWKNSVTRIGSRQAESLKTHLLQAFDAQLKADAANRLETFHAFTILS